MNRNSIISIFAIAILAIIVIIISQRYVANKKLLTAQGNSFQTLKDRKPSALSVL